MPTSLNYRTIEVDKGISALNKLSPQATEGSDECKFGWRKKKWQFQGVTNTEEEASSDMVH
jgi:hypothetical protein